MFCVIVHVSHEGESAISTLRWVPQQQHPLFLIFFELLQSICSAFIHNHCYHISKLLGTNLFLWPPSQAKLLELLSLFLRHLVLCIHIYVRVWVSLVLWVNIRVTIIWLCLNLHLHLNHQLFFCSLIPHEHLMLSGVPAIKCYRIFFYILYYSLRIFEKLFLFF